MRKKLHKIGRRPIRFRGSRVPSSEFRGGDRSEGGNIRLPRVDQRVATSDFPRGWQHPSSEEGGDIRVGCRHRERKKERKTDQRVATSEFRGGWQHPSSESRVLSSEVARQIRGWRHPTSEAATSESRKKERKKDRSEGGNI
jgi:hypothetical protein